MHHAIYVRQSLERADSVSLETQEALCRTDLPDHAEVLVYADRGFSGKNTDRPALRKLLSDIEADTVSSVIVYKLDRISRNLADFTRLLEIFRAHHVSFSSHTERFETETPMGQAMQSLLMVFAQLERETISSRVRDAAFARAKLGFDTGGTPPFGFRKIPTTLCGKHTQMLEADENAPVVTDGFRQYLLADGSLSILAKDWNERGIPTARGSIWQPESVRRVLRNPVYVRADSGVYSYLSRQGACLCIPEPLPEHHGVYLYADRRENPSKQNRPVRSLACLSGKIKPLPESPYPRFFTPFPVQRTDLLCAMRCSGNDRFGTQHGISDLRRKKEREMHRHRFGLASG